MIILNASRINQLKLLLIPTLFAAIAGGINAFLCYAKFPVKTIVDLNFEWQIIPMGALHGAILASFSIGASIALVNKNKILGILFTPFVGYIAARYSVDPLMWGVSPSDSFKWDTYFQSLALGVSSLDEILSAFIFFGFIPSVYYFLLCVIQLLYHKTLLPLLLAGIASGVLGSLWFWITYGPWYFSLIHGTIWGLFVGFGIWVALNPKRKTL